MIEWVFLDVGNVLFNDDPQSFAAFRHYHQAIHAVDPRFSFDAMLAEREELARQGKGLVLRHIARRYFDEPFIGQLYEGLLQWLSPRYDDLHLPSVGLAETLLALRARYRLGIIANQPVHCRDSLERRGLLDAFDVVAISDELSMQKPEPEIFRWAIERAGVEPGRAVMIGDRRDNDVAPAKALGFRTVHLRWANSRQKNWRPRDPHAALFLESCDRVPLFESLDVPESRPDVTISALDQAPAAIAGIEE